MFQIKFVEKIKTTFNVQKHFSEKFSESVSTLRYTYIFLSSVLKSFPVKSLCFLVGDSVGSICTVFGAAV
jgi:adenine-specific DNA methylase